jgi:hypothetical protein
MDYFKYNDKLEGFENSFRISPSQVSKFFDDTTNWYRTNLLGEPGFEGNTQTELGHVVHAAAHMYVKERTVHKDQIESYISQLGDHVDKNFIRYQYPFMVEALVNQYLMHSMPHETELFLHKKINDYVYVGGTLDSIRLASYQSSDPDKAKLGSGNTIVDYKTTSSKTTPTHFSRNYWFQQGMYCYLAKQNGYNIDYVSLVFITNHEVDRISEKTGKRMQDYPSKVEVLTEAVTTQWMEVIESTVNIITDSVTAWKQKPELRYLLAQDYRLK